MTEKWKASQALKYMEDELDAKAILQVLNPYLKDEWLAEVFDRLVDDGAISPDGYCY